MSEGGKPWGKALFGSVVSNNGAEITVGFLSPDETKDVKVGDRVILIPVKEKKDGE